MVFGRSGESPLLCSEELCGTMEANRAGDRAFTDPTQDAEGQGNGPLKTAFLREDKFPLLGELEESV